MTKDIELDTKLNTDPLYFTKEVVLEDLPSELLEIDIEDKDHNLYITAFESGDINTLEKLRKKHPEDARYNLHLELVAKDEKQVDFKKVLEAHKKLITTLGINSSSEFIRLLENGKITEAKKYANDLPKNDPNKNAILSLLKFI